MKPIWSIEPILQHWRIAQVWRYLPKKGTHVDIGCDLPPVLLLKLKKYLKQGIGLDIIINDYTEENLQFFKQDLQKNIQLDSNTADSVSMLAVLEHVKYPKAIVKEIFRLLKPGGVFVFTVPSPRLEPILPLLGSLGLVRKEMINQHENYFTIPRLQKMLAEAGFRNVTVQHFALGFNTIGVGYKKV